MPIIVPIKEMKDTAKVSSLAHSLSEPIFVTKNGYGDIVLMSIETYERTMLTNDLINKLYEAEKDIQEGKTQDALEHLDLLKTRYALQSARD